MSLRHKYPHLRLILLLSLAALFGIGSMVSAANPDSYVEDLTGINGADHFTGDHHATPIGGLNGHDLKILLREEASAASRQKQHRT